MVIDPIVGFESLGYTEREASFLYLVGMHSGYFLRRQFNYFVQRQKGYAAHRFVEKARIAGHVEVLDYGQGRFVYHLFAKPLYRMLGDPDSQNRRRKGDSSIRIRLMTLDYILETDGDHFLENENAKLDYFTRIRRIPPGLLTGTDGRLHPFLKTFPVSIADREQPSSSAVHFAFIDEGLASVDKFARFLAELGPLFGALHTLEILYIAGTEHNFGAVRHLFHKEFSIRPATKQQSFPSFRSQDQSSDARQQTKLKASFTTLLFHYNYPRLLRNEGQGSVSESEIEPPIKLQANAIQRGSSENPMPSG